MRKIYYSLVFSFLILAGLWSCNDETTGNSGDTGTLKIYLTDAPADFDAVNISFTQISAHIDSEWVHVRVDPITVNLLEWNNGNSMLLGDAEIPTGHYTQIRVKIDSAEIVVDGTHHPLTVPSGAKTGLKMGPSFFIESGFSYELVIDFDVNRSIVTMGPKHNPRGYKLKPHLRVVPMAITGSISGTVTNPENLPVAYALQESDTVATSVVNPVSGLFMLAFLESGYYTVTVTDTAGLSYSVDSVLVEAGFDKGLGSVTLE
ncbi:MAG: DUF4382 domain-containing protein [Calditrichaceae bacterium]